MAKENRKKFTVVGIYEGNVDDSCVHHVTAENPGRAVAAAEEAALRGSSTTDMDVIAVFTGHRNDVWGPTDE